jgi:hypothetical protein
MKVNFRVANAVIVGLLLATVSSAPSMAADYPPSVQACTTGKSLFAALPTRVSGAIAVVPVASTCKIPLVIGEPVTPKQAKIEQKVLTNSLVQTPPIKLSSILTLGGIGADEKAPVATFAASRKSEIQFAVGVPTRLVVTGLSSARGKHGHVFFVPTSGSSLKVAHFTVSSSGKVTVPALTFAKKNVSYSMKFVVEGGKTTTFYLRSAY